MDEYTFKVEEVRDGISPFLSADVLKRATSNVRPAIIAMMASGMAKRSHLFVGITDPLLRPGDRRGFEDAIIYAESMGNPDNWQYPYEDIAKSKGRISWETGLPSQIVQERDPYLLRPEDTPYFGTAVQNGLVVFVSGVEAFNDQLFAEWYASAVRAESIRLRLHMMEKAPGINLWSDVDKSLWPSG